MPAWWVAFLRPHPGCSPRGTYRRTPDRVGGNAVHFRATPDQLEAWLHRIDASIEYANSVVEE